MTTPLSVGFSLVLYTLTSMALARSMMRTGLFECASARTVLVAPRSPFVARSLSTLSKRPSPLSTPKLRQLSSISSIEKQQLRSAFKAKRFNSTFAGTAANQQSQPLDYKKLAMNLGLAAAIAVGLNFALNRETREALSTAEASLLNDTYKWTGLGLGITTITAKLLHSNGFAYRMMAANPWLVMIGGVALSVGSMMGVFYTAPDSPAHYLSWAAFTAMQGATLSPMFFLNPALLGRAALYTAGAFGGLSYIGATAKNEQYLYIGGPLMAGLGVLILSGLAPMVLPRMSMRAMTTLEYVGAYGGAAVFSGFILMDSQKILRHARMAEQGRMPVDPIRESVSLILDIINLFTSIVRILMLQQGNKRR